MDVSWTGIKYEFANKLAYEYWKLRGSPFGSPEGDWYAAQKAIAHSHEQRKDPFSLFSLQMGAHESLHQ